MSTARHPPGLRIAILAHSTNPRGGVVHALEVADALTDLGHEAVVHAPDPGGLGFFRPTRCATVSVPAEPVKGDLAELVERRIAEYVAHFSAPDAPAFDVYHAQDPISANAFATLVGVGVVPGFVRTVHHTDVFAEPRLTAWQDRAILAADDVLCVSRLWQDALAREYGVAATLVPSGVDARRYTPERDATDAALAARLGLGTGPVFLSVGGVEERKNTVRILAAFREVVTAVPSAQLVIAGGASLLDHSAYRRAFDAELRASGLEAGAGKSVVLGGPLPHSLMPALYRSAAALVFASVKEGFGLVVLEAMASGTPAVVSRTAPFTEHLAEAECLWVDPLDPASIARGMTDVLAPDARRRLASTGRAAAGRFGWAASARAHLDVYARRTTPRKEAAHA